MKKRLLSALTAVVACLPLLAGDFTYTFEGQTLTYSVIDETTKTCMPKEGSRSDYVYTPGNNVSGSLIIPQTAMDGQTGYTVVAISQYAFANCGELTSVTLPLTVSNIEEGAFAMCKGLTEIKIPASIKSIAQKAFFGATGLTKAEFASMTSLLSIVFADADANPLSNAHSLWIEGKEITELNFSDYSSYTTEIPPFSFVGCKSLTKVDTGNSCTRIGSHAFESCSGLTEVIIGEAVENIYDLAFGYCGTIASMQYNATNCSVFTSGVGAWMFGTDLEKLSVGSNVVSIGSRVFAGLASLKTVTLGNSLASLGSEAFSGCTALSRLTLPESLTEFGNNVFYNCNSLTDLTVLYTSPESFPDDTFKDQYATVNLIIPAGTLQSYLTTTWSLFTHINGEEATAYSADGINYRLIPASEGSAGNVAIVTGGNYADETITIPSKVAYQRAGSDEIRWYDVKAIGYKAFAESGISFIQFDSSPVIATIGDYAFYNGKLTHISLPESVRSIGDYAFFGNSLDDGIEFRGDVEIIGENAFNLVADTPVVGEFSLIVPESLKKVGKDAFGMRGFNYVVINDLASWCEIDFANAGSSPLNNSEKLIVNGQNVSSIQIPETITEIKNYTFSNFRSLNELTIPEGITSIGEGSFMGCTGIAKVEVPATVEYIGREAFNNCTVLTDVAFADGSESLELDDNAFEPFVKTLYIGRPVESLNFELKELTTLVIGNTVEEVAPALCSNATALKSLTLGSNLSEIGYQAFAGCTSLKEVVVPPMVETIGASAFAGNTSLSTIIIGPNVKRIGEKAFNGAKALNVSITAPTPPAASNNVFSTYTGKLHLQGSKAADSYRAARTCWNRFNSDLLTEATEIILPQKEMTGEAGTTIQLSATMEPADASLPQLFWRSTNPEIATVDHTGKVTLHIDVNGLNAAAKESGEANGCEIIVESLYADGPQGVAVVLKEGSSGIEPVIPGTPDSKEIDWNAPYDVYDLNGIRVATSIRNLDRGIYIVRQGNNTKKIVLR